MKRLFNLLLISTLLLSFASCNNKSNKSNKTLSDYETFVDVFDNSKTISKLQFKNVPNKPIEIGYFSSSGIILEASYTDGSVDRMHLTEKMFTKEQLNEFKTPGKKTFDFIYRKNHLTLSLEFVEAKTPAVFTVKFLDNNGTLLESKLVKYLDKVSYTGSKNIDYKSNNKYYKFDNIWDKNLDYIYSNIETKPIYKECDIENSYDDYLKENGYLYSVAAYDDSNDIKNALVYIGRINNATLVSLNPKERIHYTDTELTFDIDKSVSRLQFTSSIGDNLNNKILLNNYYHEQMNRSFYGSSVFSAYLLDFNQSNALLRDFDDAGFNSFSLKPIERSGHNTAYKSVLNHMNVDPYNVYTSNNSNKLNLLEDDNLGNYQLSLMSDLDIYLNIKFVIKNDYGVNNFYLNDAKLVVSYVPDTVRMGYKFSSDDFNTYSNKFIISNSFLADTLYDYVFLKNKTE